jgi:hypothetical protein
VLDSFKSALATALGDVKSRANSEKEAWKFLFVELKDIENKPKPYLFISRSGPNLLADVKKAVNDINTARQEARAGGNKKAVTSKLSVPSRKVYGTVFYNGNFVLRTDDAGDENFQAYKVAFRKTASNGGLLGLHEKLTKQRTDYLRSEPLALPTDPTELPGHKSEDTTDAPSEGLDLLDGLDELDELDSSTDSTDDSGLDLLDGLDELDTSSTEPSPDEIPPPPDLDLDLDLGEPEEESDPPETVPASLREAWTTVADDIRDTITSVDNGLEKLRGELVGNEDPELAEIGEKFFGTGFPVLHGGHKVPFTAKLLDVQRSAVVDKYLTALQALRDEADDYLDHIQASVRVEVCDDNPAHNVGMRASMSRSLGALIKEADRQISLLREPIAA